MAVNKNFPNYSKADIRSKVIVGYPAGDNRKGRRKLAWIERTRPAREAKQKNWDTAQDAALARREKTADRAMANRLRAHGRRVRARALLEAKKIS